MAAVLTFLAFLPVLGNGFVNWDDNFVLTQNFNFRGLGWANLKWMFTTFYMGHYQPLTWLSYALDFKFYGMAPGGYHFTSLLLHCANAALCYLVSLKLLAAATEEEPSRELRAAALFSALFFAVHPLRVESVAWATERRDVLSGLFFFFAILWYLKAAAGRARLLAAACGFYLLSLLSKGMAVTLPALLLILDVYPLRRLPADPRRWVSPEFRGLLTEKTPFALLALAAGAAGLFAQVSTGATRALNTGEVPGLALRLVQSLYAAGFYCWKTFFPSGLLPLYERASAAPLGWPVIAGAALTLLATWYAWRSREKYPAAPALWSAFLLMLVPVAQVVAFGPYIVADRYSYLPCLPFALAAGALLLKAQRAFGRRGPLLVAAQITLLLGGLAHRQAALWKDPVTLWTHTIAHAPASAIAHSNLGTALAAAGRPDEALNEFRAAAALNPRNPQALNNLAASLIARGLNDEALPHLKASLDVYPAYPEAHYNLGLLYSMRRDFAAAEAEYRAALAADPGHADSHAALAGLLTARGAVKEAEEHSLAALRARPDLIEAYSAAAAALAAEGRAREAEEKYRAALNLRPGDAAGYNNLANFLLRSGRRAEAVAVFRAALAIRPDVPELHNGIAVALSDLRDYRQAEMHFAEALRLKPAYPEAYYNLGNTEAEQGRLAEATELFRRAVTLRTDYPEAHHNLGLALFLAGKYEEAAGHYRQAIRSDPKLAVAYKNLGDALAALGRPAEARENYAAAVKLDPALAANISR